jgi:hypothetical protein
MKERKFLPPPTRFGGGSTQPKAGVGTHQPSHSSMAVRPTAANLHGSRLHALNTTAAVQCMEQGFIGDRVREKGNVTKQITKFKNSRSERLRTTYGQGTGKTAPQYYGSKKNGYWDYSTRPSFRESLWIDLADSSRKKNGIYHYTCVQCDKDILRMKDKPSKKPSVDDATIDHKVDWKKYILSAAAPDAEGAITQIAAVNAYNDLKNLQIMCRSCNASKNGPKGIYD